MPTGALNGPKERLSGTTTIEVRYCWGQLRGSWFVSQRDNLTSEKGHIQEIWSTSNGVFLGYVLPDSYIPPLFSAPLLSISSFPFLEVFVPSDHDESLRPNSSL